MIIICILLCFGVLLGQVAHTEECDSEDRFPIRGVIPATPDEIEHWNTHKSDCGKNDESNNQYQFDKGTTDTWYYVSPYYYYYQYLDYSCVPACVRMVLYTLTNGSDYPEAYIRQGCGTTTDGTSISSACLFINDELEALAEEDPAYENHYNYAVLYSCSQSVFVSFLNSRIRYTGVPSIIGVQESIENGWHYSPSVLESHAVFVFAVNSDATKFKVMDPWAGHAGASQSWQIVELTAGQLYSSYLSSLGLLY